jgi:lambda family phage portal protein
MAVQRPGLLTRLGAAFFRGFTRGWDTASKVTGYYALPAPVAQLLEARRRVGSKTAYLAENNGLIASIILQAVTAIVADGPSVRPNHPDPEVAKELLNRWNRFSELVDVEGTMSLGAYLTAVARAFFVDGESFTRLVANPDSMTLKLQLLTSDQVDSSKTLPTLSMTEPRTIAGIEFAADGSRAGYWIFEVPPDSPWPSIAPAVRIDAADILHVFEARFAGQPRGLSPIAPVGQLAHNVDEMVEASVVKMYVTSLLSMIIKDPSNQTEYLLGPNGVTTLDVDEINRLRSELVLGQGSTLFLPPGADVSFPPSAEVSSAAEIMRTVARLVSAGVGVPHALATGDYSEINYSAGKVAMATFQRRVKAIQANHIVSQLLNQVWARFVLLEVLSGRLRADDYESAPQNYTATFLWPGWPPLDELKTAKANTLNLAAKIKSREEIIAESGRDVADVNAEIEGDPLAADVTASGQNIANQPDQESVQ